MSIVEFGRRQALPVEEKNIGNADGHPPALPPHPRIQIQPSAQWGEISPGPLELRRNPAWDVHPRTAPRSVASPEADYFNEMLVGTAMVPPGSALKPKLREEPDFNARFQLALRIV